MAKAGGTYPSIVNGVSSKPAHQRKPGQVHEQVNMLSDPVAGLVRRRGTRFASRLPLALTSEQQAELQDMDVFDFVQEGREYALLYRRKASVLPNTHFAFLYDKTGESFIPIRYENSSWVNTLVSGGASSMAALGSYVYIAGNDNTPTVTETNLWQEQSNLHELSAWVRVGKFNTKYTVTLRRADNTTLEVSFTTVTAAYPGTLDTSDIPFYLPDGTTPDAAYQKHVNDRVNEYNSAVNEWIVTSAQQTRPEYIAEQLSDLLVDAGVIATYNGSGIGVNDPDFVDISVSAEDDGTAFYAAGQEITDATRAPKYHFHGKVIRVRPSGAGDDEAYYLRAELENGGNSGYGPVAWFETAGVSAGITGMVAQLYIYGGNAAIASTGAGLETLLPGSGPHVPYTSRVVGDGLTSPTPWFVGKRITMLSVFQDRLVVGSDNYVNFSRSGDYLNFWRGSVVNISDSDPVEIFAFGSEGDTLRHAVLYNGNLIIFGDRQQYGVPGDTVLSPKNPLIKATSANKDSTDAKAQASGNFIFYAQYGDFGVSLHQMRVGALNGQATVTDELSEEVGSWLNGAPLQIAAVTAPQYVLFRTAGNARMFYLYRYEDNKNNGQRVIEAWQKFEYAPGLGHIVGVSSHRKSGLVFTARPSGIVADVLDFTADEQDGHGCIDSRTRYSDRANSGAVDGCLVVNRNSPYFLLGSPEDRAEEFLAQFDDLDPSHVEYGVVSPAMVTPTNPFPRDQNGQAVLDGRMSLNRVTVDVVGTGGMMSEVWTRNALYKATDFEGRILGDSDNLIGRQPVFTGQLPVGVGREVRECWFTLRSKDWLPLRVVSLAWVGQTFNNVRRVS